MNLKNVDILAISAHPDDLELGCGGTILRSVNQGQTVGMVDLTRGEMGTRGTPEVRKREAEAAAKVLGAAFRAQLDFGDGGLRTTREEELELIRLLRDTRPSVVIAPYPEERHPDHARTGRLVTDASFYAGLRMIETGQKAHRPNTVIYFMQNIVRRPSFVMDISATFERKMEAIRSYKSQFHDPQSAEPMTRLSKASFLAMIEGRARHYGWMIGADYGEPFFTLQPPRVDDLVAAYHGLEAS
jgi:bacillithiol biosynthesis deacetylase BshB1